MKIACALILVLVVSPWINELTAFTATSWREGAIIGGLVVLGLVVLVSGRRVPRDLRSAVEHLHDRGHSVAQIARRLYRSQDAVRGLLQPDPAARRTSGRGNSFRLARRHRWAQ